MSFWRPPIPDRNFILLLEDPGVDRQGFINGGVQCRSVRLAEPTFVMMGLQAGIGPDRSGNFNDEFRRKHSLGEADEALVELIEQPGDWNG